MVSGTLTKRVRQNFVTGRLSQDINDTDTTLTATDFALLPEVVAPDYARITVDPDEVGGAPEVITVTAHTAGSDTITGQRGQEGSTARSHLNTTEWKLAMTADDFDAIEAAAAPLSHSHDVADLPPLDYVPLSGGTMTGLLTLSGDPTAALHAVTKQYADLHLLLDGSNNPAAPNNFLTQAAADLLYVEPTDLVGGTDINISGTTINHDTHTALDQNTSGLTIIDRVASDARGHLITLTTRTLQSATTSQQGVVQLTSSETSTSTSLAPTASVANEKYGDSNAKSGRRIFRQSSAPSMATGDIWFKT